MRECKHCNHNIYLEPKLFANHVRWCDKRPQKDKDTKNISLGVLTHFDNKLGIKTDFTVTCEKCNDEFTVNEREKQFPKKEKYYCSKSCANSRDWSKDKYEKTRIKRSNSVKKLWENEEYAENIINKTSNINPRFTSKNEVLIREHFKTKFPNDEWTFGGNLIHNEQRMSRDLYSKKLKVCIEYDGIWHFKDIHGQLESKRIKDVALKDWCKEHSYKLIRIDEDWFSINKLDEIESLTYESNEQLILLGERY